MKSLAPLVGFSLALAAAGLGSGCASSTPVVAYHQPAQDFEVVESSTERPLNATELAEVRSSVTSYLDREGVSDSGDYFLKVYLTPENVDAESEWVVVRFTRYTAERVAVASTYPYDSLMYSSYYPYYAYDIYPYGYGCVARVSFQYYVDPFYHQRYYYYPHHGHDGHKGDNHDTANNHGGNPNHSGDHNGADTNPGPNRPSGSRYTGNRWPTAPHGGAAASRDNRNNPTTPVARQEPDATSDGTGQQRDNPRNQWRGRPGVDARSSGIANTGNRPDAPDRVNNPNARQQDHRPVNSTTASTQNSAGNPVAERRSDRTSPRPAPSGVNTPPRTTPAVTRPAPSYSRPAPSVQQTRAPAPSYQQPARSAPAASDGNKGDSQQNSNGQREAMR